jgi:uncharacterized membrane protein
MATSPAVSMDLLVLAFASAPTASWALPALRALTLDHHIHIASAALLTHDAHGAATCVEVTDLTGSDSAPLGPFASALIGALGGPAGAMASDTRGAASGGVTKRIDRGISIANLRRLQSHLIPNSSALVILVEHAVAQRLRGALAETAFLSEAEQILVVLSDDLELLTADLATMRPTPPAKSRALTYRELPAPVEMSRAAAP